MPAIDCEANKELINKAEETLKYLANKMETGVDSFWPAFVRQQYIDATTTFLWCILVNSCFACVIPMMLQWKLNFSFRSDDDAIFVLIRIVAGMMCMYGMYLVWCCVDAIGHVLNPRYWAVKDFVGSLFHSE